MSVLDLQGMQIDVQNPGTRAGGSSTSQSCNGGGGGSGLSLLLCTGLGAI
jgi:hypothetical protein